MLTLTGANTSTHTNHDSRQRPSPITQHAQNPRHQGAAHPMAFTKTHLLIALAAVTALELAGQVVVHLQGVLADLGGVAVHDVAEDALVPHLLAVQLQPVQGRSLVRQDLLLAQPVLLSTCQHQMLSPAGTAPGLALGMLRFGTGQELGGVN